MSDTEAEISTSMIDAWSAMAKSDNPSIAGFKWPEWNTTSSLRLIIGEDGISVSVVNYTTCDFWD
jgi:hypothetical protein